MHGPYCKEHDDGAFSCARCGDISCWTCGKPKDTDTYKTIGSMYCANPRCQRERKIEEVTRHWRANMDAWKLAALS